MSHSHNDPSVLRKGGKRELVSGYNDTNGTRKDGSAEFLEVLLYREQEM